MGASHLFFNADETYAGDRGFPDSKEKFLSLGSLTSVQKKLESAFGKISWGDFTEGSCEGWQNSLDPYIDLNLYSFNSKDIHIVTFRKSSTQVLTTALTSLAVNNVFNDNQEQIIGILKKSNH